jgi:hypothetical protein
LEGKCSLFFYNEPIWLAHRNKRFKLMEAPQNRRFYVKMECLPLWPNCTGEKGRTLGKTYGIKVRCYWKHPWGAHWEPHGNTLRPWREHVGNTPPKFKRKKKGTLSACWAFPLAAWSFYFQKHLSPFFARANTPIRNWGYLYIYICCLQHFKVVCWMWTFWEKKSVMWCWTYLVSKEFTHGRAPTCL